MDKSNHLFINNKYSLDMEYPTLPFSDKELIEGLVKKDYLILKKLEQHFKKRIKGMLWKLNKDKDAIREQIEMVYTETLARVRYNILTNSYKDYNNFAGYFMAIARNIAIEGFRTKMKDQKIERNRIDIAPIDQPSDNNLDYLVSTNEDIEEVCNIELLDSCIKKQAEADQELMDLHYNKGYDLSVIADKLGISYSAIKVRFCRLRNRIRSCYEKHR